jgi:predicted MPP superfamily phosphohydrolase
MKFKRSTKSLFIIILSGIVFILYSSLETRWIKITHITIKSSDIPQSFDGKRIVFVSDIHHGTSLSRERVKKLVVRINSMHPDIIVLGGDYISMEEEYIKPVFTELGKLKSNYGVFGVLGNHDYYVNGNLSKKMMAINGIKECDNKSYWLKIGRDSIKIGGVDDPDGSKQVLDSTIWDVQKKDFCILISHRPEYVKQISTDLVDLTLSGHTHGGQVTFFGLWAPVLPTENETSMLALTKVSQQYSYGLYQRSKTMQSYITSGIGTRFPHLRFFRRPEIAVLELKRE